MQYDFSTHETMAQAEQALEDLFATGEVLEGELPHIERRRSKGDGKACYVVVVGYEET
jgi:hypothetical protein